MSRWDASPSTASWTSLYKVQPLPAYMPFCLPPPRGLAVPGSPGGQKWVSCWASLADSYSDPGLSGGWLQHCSAEGGLQATDWTGGRTQRRRRAGPCVLGGLGAASASNWPLCLCRGRPRAQSAELEGIPPCGHGVLLPQLPSDRADSPAGPEVARRSGPGPLEVGGEQAGLLLSQEDLEPDSPSDASGLRRWAGPRAGQGAPVRGKTQESPGRAGCGQGAGARGALGEPAPTSFFISDPSAEAALPRKAPAALGEAGPWAGPAQRLLPPTTTARTSGPQREDGHPAADDGKPPELQGPAPAPQGGLGIRPAGKLHQGAARPAAPGPAAPDPQPPLLQDLAAARAARMDLHSQDTHLILKETETALAALEARLLSKSLEEPEGEWAAPLGRLGGPLVRGL